MAEFVAQFAVPIIILVFGLFIEYWLVQPWRKSYESKQRKKISESQPNHQRTNSKNGFMKAFAWVVVGKADDNFLTSLVFGFVELIFSAIRWAIVGGISGIVIVAFIWIISVGIGSSISGIQEAIKSYAILGGVLGTILRIILWPYVMSVLKFMESRNGHISPKTKTSISLKGISRDNGQYASISVHNNDSEKSIFCTLYLKKIYWLKEDSKEETRWVDITQKVNGDNNPLSWHRGSNEPEVEILPSKDRIANIIKFESKGRLAGHVIFTFHGPEKDYWSGKFRIWVDVLRRADKSITQYETQTFVGCIDTIESVTKGFIYELKIWECENVGFWRQEKEGETIA